MKRSVLSALILAIATSAALPAFAASAGKEQLAAGLGVDADAYTAAELIRLREVLDDGDTAAASWIIEGGMREHEELPGRTAGAQLAPAMRGFGS